MRVPKLDNKITNIMKWSYVSRVGDDSGNFPRSQITYNGKTSDIMVLTPYGIWHNLPNESLVLAFNIQGQEENKAGLNSTRTGILPSLLLTIRLSQLLATII